MCEGQSIMGPSSIMETVLVEIWELLTTGQMKKVAVMRMDKFIKILEMKLSGMEKMIKLKKKAIVDIRKVQEMMK